MNRSWKQWWIDTDKIGKGCRIIYKEYFDGVTFFMIEKIEINIDLLLINVNWLSGFFSHLTDVFNDYFENFGSEQKRDEKI